MFYIIYMKQVAYYTDKQKQDFAKRLIALRKAEEKSQKTIANIIGVSLRAYQSYEASECMPRTDTLISLAGYYEIPLPLLIYGSSYSTNEELFFSYLYLLIVNKKLISERNMTDSFDAFKFVLFPTNGKIESFLNELENIYVSKKDKDITKFDIAEYIEIIKRLKTNTDCESINAKYKELLK